MVGDLTDKSTEFRECPEENSEMMETYFSSQIDEANINK